MVRVRQMGIRSTVARTLEDEDLIIPNSILVKSTVKNFTLRDTEYRLRALVGVIYGSDMRLVRSTLEKVTQDLPWTSAKREPRILLRDFGSSSVDFEVSVWIDDPWSSQARRSDLREAIWWAFQDAGITIAFPQVDVHFDRPINDYVEGLRRAV